MLATPVIIWGAGGHAKVISELIARSSNWCVVGFIDDIAPQRQVRVFAGQTVFPSLESAINETRARHIFVAIGNNDARLRLIENAIERQMTVITVIAPNSWISQSSTIGAGTAIMSGAVINADALIGTGVIVNTNAVVEHDCIVNDGVSIGPGAVLCGNVVVNKGAFIGAGCVVRERITVGQDCIIGCGAALVADVERQSIAYGVPAKVVVQAEPELEAAT
ncbi:MAG: acetyltransferase [Planctomycetes bacterium]|nr:acetyltransferase [Planctomycetota bacterium]